MPVRRKGHEVGAGPGPDVSGGGDLEARGLARQRPRAVGVPRRVDPGAVRHRSLGSQEAAAEGHRAMAVAASDRVARLRSPRQRR
eukprot:8502875-Pyramimonas_sp.AAC.1